MYDGVRCSKATADAKNFPALCVPSGKRVEHTTSGWAAQSESCSSQGWQGDECASIETVISRSNICDIFNHVVSLIQLHPCAGHLRSWYLVIFHSHAFEEVERKLASHGISMESSIEEIASEA